MRTTIRSAVTCFASAMLAATTSAAPIPYWFDGFDVSGPSSNINFETATRQGGPLAGTPYVTNSPNPANDYHHQLFGPNDDLQLAADTNLIPGTGFPFPTTLVSPNVDFSGTVGDQAIGRKVSVDLDAYFNGPAAGLTYTTAAITVGATSPLTPIGTPGGGLSVVFVEDNFQGGAGVMPESLVNFIQIFDGDALIGNVIPNPAGAGRGAIEIFLNDPVDGDPFDGVGVTEVGIAVNSTPVFNFTKGGGGYTSNFITLEGGLQTAFSTPNAFLATHRFDNLTVFTDTVIPEPTSFALLACAAAGFVARRRG